jgi:hypothetical protein
MQDAETLRVAALGAGDIGKGRKKNRRREEVDPGTAAHEAARAGMGMPPLGEDEHGDGGACKGFDGIGAHEEPGDYTEPGMIDARDFTRGPLEDGQAALSPQHEAPTQMPPQAPTMPEPRAVDLTGSRAVAYLHSPVAPGGGSRG